MEELRTDVVGWVVVLALRKELHRTGAQVLHFTESSLLWGYCPSPHHSFLTSIRKEHRGPAVHPINNPCPTMLQIYKWRCHFSSWEVASLTANIISENYRKFHVGLMQGDRTSEKQTKTKPLSTQRGRSQGVGHHSTDGDQVIAD